jgi:septal ring factor EnvC (AmiA/AmiB activator)
MATVKQMLTSLTSLRKKRAELDKKIVQVEQTLAVEFSKAAAAQPKTPAKRAVKKGTNAGSKRGRKPATPTA